MGRVIRIAMLVLVLAPGLALAGCSSADNGAPAPAPAGKVAPDFELQGLDGQAVSLSGLRGKPVMLNFWASWCGPCREEMPYLQEVSEDREWAERGLVILAVNIGESPATARKFMEDNGFSFRVLLDTDQSVASDYNIRAIPTTIFIDENGIVRDEKIGSFSNKAEIDMRLADSILARK